MTTFWKVANPSRAQGALLALALAFTAQYLFTGEVFTRTIESDTWVWTPSFTWGVILLLAALACFAWATFGQQLNGVAGEAAAVPSGERGEVQLGLIGKRDMRFFVAAGIAYLASLVIYVLWGESWRVQLFWVLGIGLLIVPLWRRLTSAPHRAVRWEWALVVGITAIGFLLRYWRLTEIPDQIDNDLGLMGNYARLLIQHANYNWVGYSASQHLLSYDQTLAWGMRLFGQDHYGLVMRSVILGTLTLPLLYWLGRELFGRRVGLVAMVFLTVEYTPIQFSRTMFGPSATFFAVLVFYLLFRAMRERQAVWFVAAGAAMGLGLLNYDSGRVIPLIALALCGWDFLWQRETRRARIGHWAAVAFGAFVGFGPMLGFALLDFNNFIGRGNVVMLWEPRILQHEMGAYKVSTIGEVLIEQTRRAFLAFHLYGDGSPHFTLPYPMVSAVLAALLTLGLGYCLIRLRDNRHFVLVMWIVLTLILGGVLTYDPPYWPHLSITLPAVAIIAGIAVDRMVEIFSPISNRLGQQVVYLALGAILILTGVHNWQVYYDFAKDNAGPIVMVSRYVRTLPLGYTVYLVDAPFGWGMYTFKFFNVGFPGENTDTGLVKETSPAPNRPLLFLLLGDQELLSFLQTRYPGGKTEEHYNYTWENPLIFTSYAYAPKGITLPPPPVSPNRLSLPGWWLIGGVLLALGGWAGYRHWQTHRTVSRSQSDIIAA